MIPCHASRVTSRGRVRPSIEGWPELVVLLIEFSLQVILGIGSWGIRLKQVSDLIIVELQEGNAKVHPSIYQLLNEQIVKYSWYQSHSFSIYLMHYLIITRVVYWLITLSTSWLRFRRLPSILWFLVLYNLIEHEFDLTFFNFAANISLHSVCLTSWSWPINNYIAILSLNKLFAHFFSALIKYLRLTRFIREDIFKLIVSVSALEVRTSQYFECGLSILTLGHDKYTRSVVFNLVINHFILFILGKRPNSCRNLDKNSFIL